MLKGRFVNNLAIFFLDSTKKKKHDGVKKKNLASINFLLCLFVAHRLQRFGNTLWFILVPIFRATTVTFPNTSSIKEPIDLPAPGVSYRRVCVRSWRERGRPPPRGSTPPSPPRSPRPTRAASRRPGSARRRLLPFWAAGNRGESSERGSGCGGGVPGSSPDPEAELLSSSALVLSAQVAAAATFWFGVDRNVDAGPPAAAVRVNTNIW